MTKSNTKKIKKSFLLLILFMIAFPLFPRDVTVIVIDSDLDIPLEGATIRTREGIDYICDENGSAVIQVPDDRQVYIQAIYPGYERNTLLIPVTGDVFTVGLKLTGISWGQELIIEASRPGLSETRTGRSIAVTSDEISKTAEIGLIEDVMNTIKLLPGVNYSGFFNAQPSIRGGYPGDLSAFYDGFYISNPYHWAGVFSIFDPRMIQNAQLSHGVFSSRYGYTISGLLEITSKTPSTTETMFELSLNTSAASLNFSAPLSEKGGIILMGRVTYYEPIVAIYKSLSGSNSQFDIINFIDKAPYITAAAVSGNYQLTDNLRLSATAFWGVDGIGLSHIDSSSSDQFTSERSLEMDYVNYQGFITTTVSWIMRHNMLLKFTGGLGYEDRITSGGLKYEIYNPVSQLLEKYPVLINHTVSDFIDYNTADISNYSFNAQGRVDYDWEFSDQLLLSAGIQYMISNFTASGDQTIVYDIEFSKLSAADQIAVKNLFNPGISASNVWDNLRINIPIYYSPETGNYIFSTSSYIKIR